MRKLLVVSIPIVTMTLFILIMISGNFLKMPMGKNDDIKEHVQLLLNNINDENWEEAEENIEKLSEAWGTVVRRIQFSEKRDEISAVDINLVRIRGAIVAKDKVSSIAELYEAYEHWKQIGK